MNRLFRHFSGAILLALAAGALPLPAAGQVALPIQYRRTEAGETWINYQSRAGVPISTTQGVPPGSDGRQPTGNESTGVPTPPTGGQFRSLMSFGAVPGLSNARWLSVSNSTTLQNGVTPFSGAVAAEMDRPRGLDGNQVVLVLRRAEIGAPFLSREVSFNFGSVVSPPVKDERGVILTPSETSNYWLAEPQTTNNHANSGYYWSRHARLLYAIQPGPIFITWRKATPYTAATKPVGYVNPNGPASYVTNGANIFLLYTEQYVVSGSPAKPPRKMYWTQKGFQNTGKAVLVPTARVGAVNIVYNNSFPRTVTDEFEGVGSTSPTDGNNQEELGELRTLWYEQQQGAVYAYNAEGRVFMELLGDLRSDGETFVPLGTEIVDVSKKPVPEDVPVELGERIVPPPDGDLSLLFPEPIQSAFGNTFAFQHSIDGAPRKQLYATRETLNQNDYLVHWMEEGEAGLKWPKSFGRYKLVWPKDVSRYSHFVRPEASTDDQAALTAVVLKPENAPNIEYQDPLDRPRAKFTSDFKFYTWLDPQYPVHRTLLRYGSGENIAFERVFSWLDTSLLTTNFTGNTVTETAQLIAKNLSAWNPTTQRFDWPADFQLSAPRVVNHNVDVGARIQPPAETDGADGPTYVAGHIHRPVGTSYNTQAYLDPLAVGFEAANLGAIIPVNAIPGANHLEVWWFRTNTASAGPNAGNNLLGFRSVHWPSVIGHYTSQWPPSPREIVLASLRGGSEIEAIEGLGTIYAQNDPTLDGFNPNEEHALISGGIPYATRDDLNIVSGPNYSSHPFVLVHYVKSDLRPAMAVFRVLREKPEEGFVFDYVVPAGQMLQPPPPLGFLQKPVEGSGDLAFNYNREPTGGEGDLPGGWSPENASGSYSNYIRFTYRDRKENFWVYRATHAGIPALQAGTYNPNTRSFSPLSSATAVVGTPFRFGIHASRQDEFLSLTVSGAPAWLTHSGFVLHGTPQSADVGTRSVELVLRDLYDQTRITNTLSLQVVAGGSQITQAPLSVRSTNTYTGSIIEFTNRPPFLGHSPGPSNSFTLRYYYKTLPNFAWPNLPTPPPPGSIVPYLRRYDPNTSSYVGNAAAKSTDSLDIVYRPFWPVRDPKDGSKPVPTLPYGATLTKPALNLPGVRDFKTAHIYYQQSIAADVANPHNSAVLHDPTRAKSVAIDTQFEDKIPAGIKTENYQGKSFFPLLPPHLVNRVFIDPNKSSKGSLVLIGQFKEELLGENYILLNVLRGSDLQAVFGLCPTADTENYPKWTNLVAALATDVETFHEDLPSKPGTYVPNPDLTQNIEVGRLADVHNDNTAVDSYAISATGPGSGYVTLLESSGTKFTEPGDPIQMHIFKVGGDLYRGELKIIEAPNPLSEIVTFQHTGDLAGRFAEYEYEWKVAAPVDSFPPVIDASMSRYIPLTTIDVDIPRYSLGGAGVQALGDNYVVMRYRPIDPSHPRFVLNPTDANWSEWTKPALAEGWIKRVLKGINPFNQRLTDLFNNRVNTDVSLITQAGRRWEGDVALNIDTINNYGLIEIYETVLRRGRSLSIESGFNYGPANDALLLAASYINDLYMMLGNEAWADGANPTIGIGTADNTYGDIATALFAFRGQQPSLLEEELALLRGRDDFFLPGVEITPVYNRLIWNYTRGIDAGEVIYAINYNIQENPNRSPDGIIDAEDAARMFPQGHGDAYGHYLTALKGYYSLLLNSAFDWVPRIEAVNVLGQPVSVDYLDERKFAAAAAATARAGRQIYDLTWRKDYQLVSQSGWDHFSPTRSNTQRHYVAASNGSTNNPTRYWGADHWATRTGQGAFLNWVIGNAILPDVDPIPTHEGIQKVDRTTVPELKELALLADGLQDALENAEGGLSPLGVPEGGIAFDINPNVVVGPDSGTHFEQIYERAKASLKNAVAAFDDAKDVTRLMRSEQDSLADIQAKVAQQERAYDISLIELYGTPYPDDIGPGKLYRQGYAGPDLLHYAYVDLPETQFPEVWTYSNTTTWEIPLLDLPADWVSQHDTNINFRTITNLSYNIGPHGFAEKPGTWASRRYSPGKIQQAISAQIFAHIRLRHEINDLAGDLVVLNKSVDVFEADVETFNKVWSIKLSQLIADEVLEKVKFADELFQKFTDSTIENIVLLGKSTSEALPKSLIVGVASGGDLTFAGRAAIEAAGLGLKQGFETAAFIRFTIVKALEVAVATTKRQEDFWGVGILEREQDLRGKVQDLGNKLGDIQERMWTIQERLREYDDAQRQVRTLVASGDTLQAEREIFRQRTSAVVQGYRTRDAAFRIFRNEKLERYKNLFDLAARYSLLAANAYDYETGLLNTTAGREFTRRIINSRALGVVRQGEPQFAGSNTGDPGLSSALAEMKADWGVLRGRLGFNNPDAYGTTVSLRTEKLRILPGSEGDTAWKDILHRARTDNILADADVRRYCMQVDPGAGLQVPGIILNFGTTIADGLNLFGQPLAAGDSAFSPSSFATKIFGVGVALEGYRGMNNPAANNAAVTGAGGTASSEPSSWFLDATALSATPYVYLVPVGVDSMRSPPLGDSSTIRTWNVDDLAIPMPFNIGASGFSTQALYQSADSLSEPLFALRKHQAFRPVSDSSYFSPGLYGPGGTLVRSQFTNNRLVGRSVWNSQWKLVIPGRTLLNNPNEGLDRFIRTVKDIKLHFVTYSYSGN